MNSNDNRKLITVVYESGITRCKILLIRCSRGVGVSGCAGGVHIAFYI